ncbi:anaerobic ribonucleoside-triphosphate reductase activating protein [Porticoccaceae bacterium LTM1]|nr:anaerobic ribonucleoside-triphosphate reductase activating protein [Porticoccaceae bacterium LTM1]
MNFNYARSDIVFQEVPDHISLAFTITGCQLRCKGCHSAETWNANIGRPLTRDRLLEYLNRYQGFISCVLFFGGEWQPQILKEHLQLIRERGLKTCLYTGQPKVAEDLIEHLDFVKTGSWDARLGGLSSPTTNQLFIDVKSGQSLNHKFQERNHVSAQ